jgi:hypothetical protein
MFDVAPARRPFPAAPKGISLSSAVGKNQSISAHINRVAVTAIMLYRIETNKKVTASSSYIPCMLPCPKSTKRSQR